jgi:hypothetical protein
MLDDAATEVVVPTLETLLRADGADGLTFEGIDFEHTTWTGPDSYYGCVVCICNTAAVRDNSPCCFMRMAHE